MPERLARLLRGDLVLADGRLVEDVQERPGGSLVVVVRYRGQRSEALVVDANTMVEVLGELRPANR
jgi:hypothetical protein